MWNWFVISSTVLFKWIASNNGEDTDCDGNLAAKLKQTQSTLSLISALVLSVVSSFLREGGTTVYIYAFTVAFFFALFSTT